jgi:hypothetical protein
MLDSRRTVLKTLAGSVGAFSVAGWVTGVAQTPKPMPSPNAPSNQNVPGGLNGGDYEKPDKPAPNPVIQEQIAAMVEQLFKLSSELRDEVQHTNLNTTFSLGFVKKAEQAEKLAKQIKNRTKG